MTAIIGVLNAQGVAIATDSAVTVSSGNISKVYNNSNKLFTLSKYHPIGIAIYDSAVFMGIPWEALIKVYRKKLGERKFDTVEKYKLDFLAFLKKNLDFISLEYQNDDFFAFCSTGYKEQKEKIDACITENESVTDSLGAEEALTHISPCVSAVLVDYRRYVEKLDQSDLIKFSKENYVTRYKTQLDEIVKTIETEISTKYAGFKLTDEDVDVVHQTFYSLTKVKLVFERHSGLVFIGFGDKEIYPSSHLLTVGSMINNTIRYLIHDPDVIAPGKNNANIIPYAQSDVTLTVLTGIDPTYQGEVQKSIRGSFKTVSEVISPMISNPAQATTASEAINDIAEKLVGDLDKYRNEIITKPLIDVLIHMGKEDMAELAESLVSITSLKRKFTARTTDESVGGPVDVAVITKGDGFIWLKRKQYFDHDLNKSFSSKYFHS